MESAYKKLFFTNPATHIQAHIDTCLHILRNISFKNVITTGKTLHGYLIKLGTSQERFIKVELLLMYLRGRTSADANELTKEFKRSDTLVSNNLIHYLFQHGKPEEARKMFDQMPKKNEISWTTMIHGFMQLGRVKESIWYFKNNPFHNVISWTAAISGCVQNGLSYDGLQLFKMLMESGIRPNHITFSSVLGGCTRSGNFDLGLSIMSLIVKAGFDEKISVCNSMITLLVRAGELDMTKKLFEGMKAKDVVTWTAILDLYVEMGSLEEARKLFDEIPMKNEVSWSAMIARYSQNDHNFDAFDLFRDMMRDGLKPNSSCFAAIINALGSLEALLCGMSVHGQIVKVGTEDDVYISSSLIDLYCKCGEPADGWKVFTPISHDSVVVWNSMLGGLAMNGNMEEAKAMFKTMPSCNAITWSALIAGFLKHEKFEDVFHTFNRMRKLGAKPNRSTLTSLVSACASIASPRKGKESHGIVIKLGLVGDVYIDSALIDMYANCGDVDSSKQVFDRMNEKDEVSWTVMIQGLAECGRAEESLKVFEDLKRNSNVTPNAAMYLAVLFACSHHGLVEKGLQYFAAMEAEHEIKPSLMHYNCVVDMLSRAGRLTEAEEVINTMPYEPNLNVWAALLNGCKTHKNQEIAEKVAAKIGEENSAGGYVLLSNILASSGKWLDVSNIRKLMRAKGMNKLRGCSWIEIKSDVFCFNSGGGNNPLLPNVYVLLAVIRTEMVSTTSPYSI